MIRVGDKVAATMVKCLLCGREFKNGSGLSGHMQFSHPSASTVDGDEIKARLQAVETSVDFLRAIVDEISRVLQGLVNIGKHNVQVVSELKQVVDALLVVHYLTDLKIAIESLPDNVKTMLKSALSTSETKELQKALGK
ncbi:hypothetical protein ES708_34154 [subsurface metagenome]